MHSTMSKAAASMPPSVAMMPTSRCIARPLVTPTGRTCERGSEEGCKFAFFAKRYTCNKANAREGQQKTGGRVPRKHPDWRRGPLRDWRRGLVLRALRRAACCCYGGLPCYCGPVLLPSLLLLLPATATAPPAPASPPRSCRPG